MGDLSGRIRSKRWHSGSGSGSGSRKSHAWLSHHWKYSVYIAHEELNSPIDQLVFKI